MTSEGESSITDGLEASFVNRQKIHNNGTQSMSRKRRRFSSSASAEESYDKAASPQNDKCATKLNPFTILLPNLRYPKHLYDGWVPQLEQLPENKAIKYLLPHLLNTEKDLELEGDDAYVTLTDFCVYRRHDIKSDPESLAPLNDLMTRNGDHLLQFSGVLRVGSKQCFVKDVSFEIMSIDGYDPEVCSVADKIYIRSRLGNKLDFWYHLVHPASEYERFHREFLWLADFGKHFACYLLDQEIVRLIHFKRQFSAWLHKLYQNHPDFELWLARYGREDFRKVIAAHPIYLYRESTNDGVDPAAKNCKHPIWLEVHPYQLGAVRKQPCSLESPTVVTPFIYNCFRHFYFADQLEIKSTGSTVLEMSEQLWSQHLSRSFLGSRNSNGPWRQTRGSESGSHTARTARVGDIIGVGRDDHSSWKDQASTWYAYVQDLEKDKDGRTFLHIIWLYKPQHTLCSTMYYAYENELFFSDHCNCGALKRERTYLSHVTELLSVQFRARPIPAEAGHFIRQTYVTQDAANKFVDFDNEHLSCVHRKGSLQDKADYLIGDTVLVAFDRSETLDPVELTEVGSRYAKCRLLRRKGRDYGVSSQTNELVYTEDIWSIPVSKIRRRCRVRFYTRADVKKGSVPPPYKYGGVADCWIVTARLTSGIVVDLEHPFPISLREGFDPTAPRSIKDPPLLKTMDLFCGGKFFGRGIEDAGASRSKCSVDLDGSAIHTAWANSKPDETFYWGSAVRYMSLAMEGRFSAYIAAIGSIDLILAGSPCQGFSALQPDKTSDRSRRNASMVALTLSYIDLYRPRYAILENVFGMTRSLGEKKDQQVFAQVVCALVGMGYQTQVFHLNAFNYESPQYRSRIFISATAPGHDPLPDQCQTHATPAKVRSRHIGKIINGEFYGSREIQNTPFPYTRAGVAIQGLPSIQDGAVGICVEVPDHRLSRRTTRTNARVMSSIPRYPREMGLMKAMRTRALRQDILELLNRKSRMWRNISNTAFTRLDPDYLFSTITTTCGYEDAKDGKILHWDEPRPMTIAEARIAQGVSDEVVIVGHASEQWKQIGNGVPRSFAVVLGVGLRQSWFQTWERWGGDPLNAAQTVSESRLYESNDDMMQDLDDTPTLLQSSFGPAANVFDNTILSNGVHSANRFSPAPDRSLESTPCHEEIHESARRSGEGFQVREDLILGVLQDRRSSDIVASSNVSSAQTFPTRSQAAPRNGSTTSDSSWGELSGRIFTPLTINGFHLGLPSSPSSVDAAQLQVKPVYTASKSPKAILRPTTVDESDSTSVDDDFSAK